GLVKVRRRSWRVVALLAFVLVLAAACSGSGASPTAGQQFSNIGNNLGDSAAKGAPAAIPAPPGVGTTPENGIPTLVTNPSRNLILTANVSMKTGDPWATADKARAIANGLGRRRPRDEPDRPGREPQRPHH